jgi:GT2 family glycosyltransferase
MSAADGAASKVTVAILNYDGRQMLEVVVPSVLAARGAEQARVLVLDNGSSDDSVAYMRSTWPTVEVLEIPSNIGVAAALNRAAEAARSEFVLLLNNDVELEPDCIEALLSALLRDAHVAVAQAKLLDFTRRELLDGTGDTYSWAGIAHRRGQGEFDSGQYDEAQDVFGACGAAAMYRRSALQEVGGFDEQFFAICEDVDWSFRARLAGYGCRYVPGAVVYHIGSASLGPRVSEFTLYHNWRNQIWVITKNYPAAALLLHLPDLLMGVAASLYVAIRHRCLGVLLRAWRDALRGLPGAREKRRVIQRDRRAGLAELEAVIDSGPRKLWWWLTGSGRSTAPAARRQPAPGERAPNSR